MKLIHVLLLPSWYFIILLWLSLSVDDVSAYFPPLNRRKHHRGGSASCSSWRRGSASNISPSSSSSISQQRVGGQRPNGEEQIIVKTTSGSSPPPMTNKIPTAADEDDNFNNPTWDEIFKAPIKISNKKIWDEQPLSKRIAMMMRASVLHLTFLSGLGPLFVQGALLAGGGQTASTTAAAATTGLLTPWRAVAWTVCLLSWHAAHNMVNDWQDMDKDDAVAASIDGNDEFSSSYRSAYGVHPLLQGFVTKKDFFKLLVLVAMPGMILSASFRNTVLGPAFLYGMGALLLYTPVFKPLALGEVLVYLVWGPFMAGFGSLAAGGGLPLLESSSSLSIRNLFVSPVSILFGSLATQMIFGKHTDKIQYSSVRTLPKLLGPKLAIPACWIALVAPYVILTYFLGVGRWWMTASSSPVLPLGSALAGLCLFREFKWTAKVLRLGMPKDQKPTLDADELKGTVGNARPNDRFPLWFVQFMGWHCITFGYLVVVGSGLEWAGRALVRALPF